MNMSTSQRNAAFINLVLTCVMLAIVSSATAVALQPLMVEFCIDAAMAGWVTGGYTLALAAAMPLTAYLVTRFRTRPLYIFAVTLYLATLLWCALAPTFAFLLAARVAGACANALIASMTQVSILSIFPKEGRGTAMGWFGLSQGAAVVLGPTVGGFLIDGFGWRALFWFAAALCALSAAWSVAAMRVALQNEQRDFDLPSFVLSVLAFGGVTLGLGNVASLGVASPLVLVPLAAGVVAGVAFSLRQLGSEQPFLKVQLLGSRVFAASVVMSMLLYMVMMGSTAVLPLYVQVCTEQGALVSGVVVMPGALAMAVVSPLAGKLFDRHGMVPLAVASGSALVAANLGMCLVGDQTPLWVASALNVVRCLAIGCIQTPLVTWGNGAVQAVDMPHASALLTSLRNVAGALGVSVFLGVVTLFGGSAGVNMAYLGMAAASACILVVGLWCRRSAMGEVGVS